MTPERFENAGYIAAVAMYAVDDPCRQTMEGFAAQVRAVNEHDTRGRLHTIEAETLCRAIPRARPLLRLPGCAHALHMENPRKFTAAVISFLS